MFGDSVYEVLAVTNGKICALRAHVSRLKASLDAVGINLKESIDDISDLLIEAVRRSEKLTGLLYLQITRVICRYKRPVNFSDLLTASIRRSLISSIDSLRFMPTASRLAFNRDT